ncbi:MAG: Hsp20/alpha crystallin family protein [Saprospiraceae bacterium]|nr:Hsp20/alpha crystallin family protein [Bacteroidia bacterium]MBT8228655.1 Hsp20/alpha crystallin family protein [Bacteroidia bacterium]NNF21885.1 Hsp20/alpha crystallin family protein [Saprospiraceae bacterium]NNK89105.1 Hsp20/alpha crystallin family protein [Saprospiraceae bacterium]
MNLIKFNRPIHRPVLTNVLDDIFNRSFSDMLGADFTVNSPSVNILEGDASYKIEMALPGVSKDDVTINVEKDQLIISSANKEVNETKDGAHRYMKREFNYSSFRKSFHLPKTVDTDMIDAKFDNGVLILTIEKKEEAKEKEPRTIVIQ